jgi:cyclophilin family peptidyl-prolyl cis-trans isomerase
MIQGGMMNSSIPTIADEFGNNNHNIKGTVAMAKTSQPNSATSQFFINVVDNSNRYATFDTTYSVFGDVIQGMDVAEAISLVQRDSNDKPLIDVQIIKAEILP